jgi:uncharacterized protein YbaR (Trm112 family)
MKAIIEIASVILSCPHCRERLTNEMILRVDGLSQRREIARVWLWEDFGEHEQAVECEHCGKGFEIPGQFEAFTR